MTRQAGFVIEWRVGKRGADWIVCHYRPSGGRVAYKLAGRTRMLLFDTKAAAQLWADTLNER